MIRPTPTRRAFCSTAALALLAPRLAQAQARTSRPDVAAIDHERILAAAAKALGESPVTITSLKAAAGSTSPHDFYSEAESPTAFNAHRDALLTLSRQVSALAAAFHLTHEEKFAAHAVLLLRPWFIAPATRLNADLSHAGAIPGDAKPQPEGIVDGTPLAEIAQSIPFLVRSVALNAEDLKALKDWFAEYLKWLTESRVAGLARDQKDHHASSWLFQAAAIAKFTGNESVLIELRHRFKTATLRAQIVAEGSFPHELTTANPYRNSLFNLDLLAACCQMLSSQFESLWDFELQDGPGLRVVMARHMPFIRDRGTWPYRADAAYFTDLPLRCSSLLFAARAYTRPEYAELWGTLKPESSIMELERSFPISQPLLWVAKA